LLEPVMIVVLVRVMVLLSVVIVNVVLLVSLVVAVVRVVLVEPVIVVVRSVSARSRWSGHGRGAGPCQVRSQLLSSMLALVSRSSLGGVVSVKPSSSRCGLCHASGLAERSGLVLVRVMGQVLVQLLSSMLCC